MYGIRLGKVTIRYIGLLFYMSAIPGHFRSDFLSHSPAHMHAAYRRMCEQSVVAIHTSNDTCTEYRCCKKYHASLENNLQTSENFLRNRFHCSQQKNTLKTRAYCTHIRQMWCIYCGRTEFCALLLSWGA